MSEQLPSKSTRHIWLVTLPGAIGPIAIMRDRFPRAEAEAGWIVEGPMVAAPLSDAELEALEVRAAGETP